MMSREEAAECAAAIREIDQRISHDPVNHPSHYTSGKYEVIDIIQDQLTHEQFIGFCLGNALKYICRAGKKDASKTKEDLEKAHWYLQRCVKEVNK